MDLATVDRLLTTTRSVRRRLDLGRAVEPEVILALRARGIGAAWTTDHLFYEAEAAALLGLPGTVTQVALLPVAYFLGADFKPAKRLPARDRTHWNAWGARR